MSIFCISGILVTMDVSFTAVLIDDCDIDISKPPPTPGKSIERDFPEIYRKFDQPRKPIVLEPPKIRYSLQHNNEKYNFSVLERKGDTKVPIRKFPNQNRSRWMEELCTTGSSTNSGRKNRRKLDDTQRQSKKQKISN